MGENIDSKERLPSQPDELFGLIDEVTKLVGTDTAMVFDPAFQAGSKKHVVDVVDDAHTREMKMRATEVTKYETMAKLSVQQHMLERGQMEKDDIAPDPIEEVSLLMTLWEYQEGHLKEYLDVLRAYRSHLLIYPDETAEVRRNPDIVAWEKEAIASLKKIKNLLPALETLHRISKYSYLLQTRNNPELQELIRWLKSRLLTIDVEGTDLTALDTFEDVREAHGILEAELRKVLGKTIDVKLYGSGGKLKSAETRSMRIGQALYLRTLSLHRDKMLEDIKKAPSPTVEQYNDFLETQKTINTLNMDHLLREAKHNADYQGLLATLTYFGPRTGELASNPQVANQFAEFFQSYVLPEEIRDQFQLKEFARVQEGMEGFLQLVEGDVLRYGKWADDLEGMLMVSADTEKKAITIKRGVANWSYVIPEHTLGYLRLVGFDYAKPFGQAEAMKNHRAVEEFIALEQSTDSIAQILSQQKPTIDVRATEVRSASADLRNLREEYPPSACKPGETYKGKTYNEIEQMYKESIDAVRESHKAYCEKIDTLYQELEKNMAFHINRLAQHRHLNAQNSPNAVVGIGITAAEALVPAAWFYGGKRGLRAVPGVAELTRLGWVKSPSKNVASWMLKTIVNAPICIVNAPTRLLIKLSGFQWVVPRSRLDASPRELRALERELAQLRGTAQAPAPQRVASRTRRGIQAIESMALNTRAVKTMEKLAECEGKLQQAREAMDTLLQQGSLQDAELAKAQDAITSRMIQLNGEARMLRVRAARQALGKRLPFGIRKSRAILEAHAVTDVAQKKAILQSAQFSSDDISLFLENHICGSATSGVKQIERITPANIQAVEAQTTRALTQAEKALVQRWWNSPALKGILHAGTVALQGYITAQDIRMLQEAERHHALAQEQARTHLDDLVQRGIFHKEGDTYWYKDKVSFRLDQLGSSIATEAANWRLAVDATSLVLLAAFEGPVGWAAIGAGIVVHTGIDAWERSEYFTFVEHVDPALLAYLGGTAATIGPEEYHLLEDHIADVFPLGKTPEVRRRIVYSWFLTHIARSKPSIYAEMLGGGDYDSLRSLYEKDFQKHIIPGIQTHLFLHARADLSLDFLGRLDVTDLLNVVSAHQMEMAFEQAASWYVVHVREKRYLSALAKLEHETDPYEREALASQVYELGSKYAFGKRLMDSKDAILKNGGLTRMELLALSMQNRLIVASKRGSWLDARDGHDSEKKYFFQDTPRIVTEQFSGRKEKEPVFSTNRDFTFSVEGIHGVQDAPDVKERVWYSSIGSRDVALSPVVPKVEDAIFNIDDDEVHDVRKDLLLRQKKLERLHWYIYHRNRVYQFTELRAAQQADIDACSKKISEMHERQIQEGNRMIGLAIIRQQELKRNEIIQRTEHVFALQQRAQGDCERFEREAFRNVDERKRMQQMPLLSLQQNYQMEYAEYMLDLETIERAINPAV